MFVQNIELCVPRRHIWGYTVCLCPTKRMPRLWINIASPSCKPFDQGHQFTLVERFPTLDLRRYSCLCWLCCSMAFPFIQYRYPYQLNSPSTFNLLEYQKSVPLIISRVYVHKIHLGTISEHEHGFCYV